MTAFRTVFRFTLLEARHGQLIRIGLLVCFMLAACGYFLQAISLIDGDYSATGIVAPLMRLAMVATIGVFVVAGTCQGLEARGLDMILSAPVSRGGWLLGRLAGLSTAACALAMMAGMTMLLFAPARGVALWSISLAGELVLVTATGLLLSVSLARMPAALLSLAALYLCARTIGTIQMIQAAGISVSSLTVRDAVSSTPGLLSRLADWLIDLLALALPRLDLMTRTPWLTPGTTDVSIMPGLLQSALFAAIAMAAAVVDFERRDV